MHKALPYICTVAFSLLFVFIEVCSQILRKTFHFYSIYRTQDHYDFFCQSVSLQKHFIIMLFSTTTCNVKSSRLKSTISAAETPEFLTFSESCFLYLHTLLSVLFDTCSYDAAYALITPVSTSHVRCCIIYHPQLKSFSLCHIHHVLAYVYLVKV